VIITLPLLEGLDGIEKMSKTLDNHVGIDEPPGEIFGKIMSVSDPLMYRYYELLTDIALVEIEGWKKEAAQRRINPRDLKFDLARRIVADFWGEGEARKAAAAFERVFKRREVPEEIEEKTIDPAAWRAKAKQAGQKATKSIESIEIVDLLLDLGILPSRGEAKRVIRQGGVSLDGRRVEDIAFRLDLRQKSEYILKVGKRKFLKLIIRRP
jgi:tyrosyl-tRNA synthetase